MKIGLMGCEFASPNKGCEALTYSIISVLDNFSQNLTIYNFGGTELGRIQNEFKDIEFINIKPSLKKLPSFYSGLRKCDFILDATMGDSFSDIYSKKYYDRLVQYKRIAQLCCKNYILLPQTYGPFNHKSSAKSAAKVFNKSKKIYCRDELSQNILKADFNVKDSELVTDMAFLLPYHKERFTLNSKKTKIGINVSGLLYAGGFNSSNQFDLKMNYKTFIRKLIKTLSSNHQYEIHLIPHVIDLSSDAHDDDYKICRKLTREFNNTILAPAFSNPIDAKSYISNMDIFIGSRMHSTIAAFSSGVVTIPVSYSRKFEGLFGSLNYEYVINGKSENAETAIEKVVSFIKDKDALVKRQKYSEKLINEKTELFISSLKNIIIDGA